MKSIFIRRILAGALACAICLALAGCAGYDKPVTTDTEEFYLAKNDQMDEKTKSQLDAITAAFEDYMSGGDLQGVKALLDSDFQATDEQLTQFAQTYADTTLTRYDSYYIKDVEPATTVIKVKKTQEDENSIELTPGSSEMYVALYTAPGDTISRMVTLLCANVRGGWKIAWMDATDYAYNGMDAPAMYEKSRLSKAAGQDISAYVYSLMLNLIMRPGNALVYKDFSAMEEYYYQTSGEFQKAYPMPYTPQGMADTVKVHGVALANEQENIIPLIILQTDIQLSDLEALRAQAKQVIAALDKASPGFAAEFAQIAFNAVNEDPTTAQNPETRSFVITAE